MKTKENSFLWREVSEKEKEEIRVKAKSIIDDFSKELEKIGKEKVSEYSVEREGCEREEGSSEKASEIDRDVMFKNAPSKNNDFIIAEKGAWT